MLSSTTKKFATLICALSAFASFNCASESDSDSPTEQDALAVGQPLLKMAGSGELFLKDGAEFVSIGVPQKFYPALPAAPMITVNGTQKAAEARISRNGVYEFIWFADTKIARLKDLRTGAVQGLTVSGEGSESVQDSSMTVTTFYRYFSLAPSQNIAAFAPADTGELSRVAKSSNTLMGSLPSVELSKRQAFMDEALLRLKAGKYNGIPDSGSGSCELQVSIDSDGDLHYSLYSTTGARRRLAAQWFSAQYLDGALRNDAQKRLGLDGGWSAILIDTSGAPRVEMHEGFGTRRVCKNLVRG